jgi:hypothetical protein
MMTESDKSITGNRRSTARKISVKSKETLNLQKIYTAGRKLHRLASVGFDQSGIHFLSADTRFRCFTMFHPARENPRYSVLKSRAQTRLVLTFDDYDGGIIL